MDPMDEHDARLVRSTNSGENIQQSSVSTELRTFLAEIPVVTTTVCFSSDVRNNLGPTSSVLPSTSECQSYGSSSFPQYTESNHDVRTAVGCNDHSNRVDEFPQSLMKEEAGEITIDNEQGTEMFSSPVAQTTPTASSRLALVTPSSRKSDDLHNNISVYEVKERSNSYESGNGMNNIVAADRPEHTVLQQSNLLATRRMTTIPDLLYSRQILGTGCSRLYRRKIGYSVVNTYMNPHGNPPKVSPSPTTNEITHANGMDLLDTKTFQERIKQQHLLTVDRTTSDNRTAGNFSVTYNLFFDETNRMMASKIAWRPERMQNMILVVGSNTPAALCWRGGDGDEDDSNEDDDLDDSDDDDDEENIADDGSGDNGDEDDYVRIHGSSDEEDHAMMHVLESQVMEAMEDYMLSIGDNQGSNEQNSAMQTVDNQTTPNSDDDDSDKESVNSSRRPRVCSTSVSGSISGSAHQDVRDAGDDDVASENRIQNTNTQPMESEEGGMDVIDSLNNNRTLQRHETLQRLQDHTLASDSQSSQPLSNLDIESNSNTNNSDNENMEDSDDGMNEDDVELFRSARNFLFHSGRDNIRTASDESHQYQRSRNISNKEKTWNPSLRHGGCINTSTWLTCPWRLSASKTSLSGNDARFTPSSMSCIDSNDCPTQIVTSGDDRLIKFWDIREAMGMSSPLPGGYDTLSPFADSKLPCPSLRKTWSNHYRSLGRGKQPDCVSGSSDHNMDDQFRDFSQETMMHGGVSRLATVNSGHRGNVFHVTPINEKPGQVVSCGADGFLRLVNLQNEESSVIIHPFVSGDDSDFDFFVCIGMAFSHLMLTANTGLLCSERGLHHFDIRLSPSHQQQQSLWNTSNGFDSSRRRVRCKACAVWSPHGMEQSDPNYFFVGGANAVVDLCDIRMDTTLGNQHHRKLIQRYKPRNLNESCNVSVSGLDVTKDGKELLVSYENDQVYTFPVFPYSSSRTGPDLNEIDAAAVAVEKNAAQYVSELAGYGGHLNRFTMLKNPKYAGPNDEYICTGCDSGNAWIYDKRTGAVAALLGADSRTCNGVIPHPTLPYFITYGIESTAKIWRASLPVDLTADDTRAGRRRAILSNLHHELSPVTRSWDGVEMLLKRFDKKPAIMPDFIATSEEIASSGHFSSRSHRGILGSLPSPRIGNALRNLPMILRQNRYECYRSFHDEGADGGPIEQPLVEFTHRVCIQRLKRQADSLGVPWNPWFPWVFKQSPNDVLPSIPPAELVPDNPSDWLLLDGRMTPDPIDPRANFNTNEYDDVLLEYFPDEGFGDGSALDCVDNASPWLNNEQQNLDTFDESTSWPLLPGRKTRNDKISKKRSDENGDDNIEFSKKSNTETSFNIQLSRKLLLETVAVLKEGGNIAMKEHRYQNAAKHYDKAIQYCAVAFMQYFEGRNKFEHLSTGHHATVGPNPNINHKDHTAVIVAVWSPLLRLLITSRLNMALLLLKPELSLPCRAADQARHALKLLAPFTRQERSVVTVVRRKLHVLSEDEPSETYWEALALQAKAYFRLGSAELDMADFAGAVKSFEQSLKCGKKRNDKCCIATVPDSLVVRRYHEAKRKLGNKKKRDRKRYQRLIAEDEQQQHEVEHQAQMSDVHEDSADEQ